MQINTKRSLHVAIAGNIGSGKSTLTRALSEHYGWQAYKEPSDENPYLEAFYNDMRRWAFHSQIYFLTRRIEDHIALAQSSVAAVQDRTIYEDAEIFARNLYIQERMSTRDYETYNDLYEAVVMMLPPPDIVIYLQCSVDRLLKQIAKRGRDYEQDIRPVYLHQLNILYDDWVEQFTICPVLYINMENIDFVQHDKHLSVIVEQIDTKMTSLDISYSV